jgi:hypothetical protein
MNILVRMKDNWYPVQNIVVDAGIFTIKTLVGQIKVRSSEQMLWLSQIPPDTEIISNGLDAWSQSPEVQKELIKQEIPAPPTAMMANSREAIAVPAPPSVQNQVQELERKLYKQQRATLIAEQRAILAERRALAAEEQLAFLQNQLQKKELEVNWPH